MMTDKVIEKVMEVIHHKYSEKGSDFIFKSKLISKDIDLSPQIVGHALAEAVNRGYPIAYYTRVKTGIHTWKTTIGDKK